jgi:ANTAR domain
VPDRGYGEVGADLAEAAGDLLTLAGVSESRAMNRLVELAARHVPGCSGASAMLWQDDEPAVTAASHPDLSELAQVQQECGRGPVADALAGEAQVSCPDTLSETRWPEYARQALAVGVRCSLTLVYRSGPVALTLTLYATRPRALNPDRLPIGELLVAFGGATMRNTTEYGAAQRTARQLTEGADSRAVVDQAKGILMAGFSCSAEEALRRMREISQARHIKVTEVARRIVESHELEVR